MAEAAEIQRVTTLFPVAADSFREINQAGYSSGGFRRRGLREDAHDPGLHGQVAPERRLLAAVLIRAAKDIAGHHVSCDNTEKIQAEVRAWANSNESTKGHGGWGFLDICEQLELPADLVRQRLLSGEMGRQFEIDGYRQHMARGNG